MPATPVEAASSGRLRDSVRDGGRAGSTFSYFAAYEPYVEHLATAIHLLDVSLGHDDKPPTHSF